MKNKDRAVVISKHIHSGFSSYSSNDETAYLEMNEKDIDFSAKENSIIYSKKFPFLNSEEIHSIREDSQLLIIHLENDKTFYEKAFRSGKMIGAGFSETIEFKELVKSYLQKGFQTTEYPQKLREYGGRDELRESLQRKKEGYVLWKRYDDLCAADFQGGFSDELFNDKEIKDYIKNGKSVFGWIGHSVRQAWMDKMIEEGLKERGLPTNLMFSWITSRDGRHFGDLLEGASKTEQTHSIQTHLNYMFNHAIIYVHPEHTGNYESTQRIENVLREKLLLLPEKSNTILNAVDKQIALDTVKHLEELLSIKDALKEIEETVAKSLNR